MLNKKMVMMIVSVLFVFAVSTFAATLTPVGQSVYTDIETPHPYPQASEGTLVWSTTVEQAGASWIKLHFSNFRLNDGDYVSLLDMNGDEIDRIEAADLKGVESRFNVIAEEPELESTFRQSRARDPRVSFWAGYISGDMVTVELHRTTSGRTGWGFNIDEVGVGYTPIEEDIANVESICGGDNKTCPKSAGEPYYSMSEAVGRMLFQNGGSWYVCTGFLVSSNSSHFLTNEHCISSQRGVDTLEVRFRYRYTNTGCSALDSYTTFYGNQFVKDSRENCNSASGLDYCLLTLTGTPQNTYGYLQLLSREPVNGEDIWIPQHPGGRIQEIAFGSVDSTCQYCSGCTNIGYMADTEGGSSGSPVLAEAEDKVIALHHYGGCPNAATKMSKIYPQIIGYISN